MLAGRIDRAISFGQSQSGRYLHDLLYFSFNTDEAGRAVFDGLMPHLAGGKKTFTNFRFSQRGRSAYQHADALYPGAEFPFACPVTTNALPGKTDGMLARCLAASTCPKINIGSRVNREVHARFWERPEVKFLRTTRQSRRCRAGLARAALSP